MEIAMVGQSRCLFSLVETPVPIETGILSISRKDSGVGSRRRTCRTRIDGRDPGENPILVVEWDCSRYRLVVFGSYHTTSLSISNRSSGGEFRPTQNNSGRGRERCGIPAMECTKRRSPTSSEESVPTIVFGIGRTWFVTNFDDYRRRSRHCGRHFLPCQTIRNSERKETEPEKRGAVFREHILIHELLVHKA